MEMGLVRLEEKGGEVEGWRIWSVIIDALDFLGE